MTGRPPPDIHGMVSLKIDNLSYRTDSETLRRKFGKYGDIGDIYIPKDRRNGGTWILTFLNSKFWTFWKYELFWTFWNFWKFELFFSFDSSKLSKVFFLVFEILKLFWTFWGYFLTFYFRIAWFCVCQIFLQKRRGRCNWRSEWTRLRRTVNYFWTFIFWTFLFFLLYFAELINFFFWTFLFNFFFELFFLIFFLNFSF